MANGIHDGKKRDLKEAVCQTCADYAFCAHRILLFGGSCLEDEIPQSVADTEAFIRTLEVVLHMVEFDPFVVSSAHLEVMSSVVGQVIPQISADESCEYGRQPLRRTQELDDDQVIESVEKGCQRNADRRRHNQSCFTHRLGMVDTVKEKGYPFHPGGFRREVKDEAVHHVLRQCPEKNPDQ